MASEMTVVGRGGGKRPSRVARRRKWKMFSGFAAGHWRPRCPWIVAAALVFLSATDSMYHLISPGDSCSVVARLNESLFLLCVHPVPGHVTEQGKSSAGGDDDDGGGMHRHAHGACQLRSFSWKRVDWNGEATVVTESRKYSLRRGGPAEVGSGSKLSLLRINSLQPDDGPRYRCDVECVDSDGRHFIRHHTVSVCVRQSHNHAICEASVSNSRCSKAFADGICDASCDREPHLFDGFDCARGTSVISAAAAALGDVYVGDGGGGGDALTASAAGRNECPTESEHKCRRSYADGVCDAECDTEPCARDGGDCIDRPLRLVDDILVLSVAESFHRDPGHPLLRILEAKSVSRAVSRLLRTVVRVITDDWVASHLKDVDQQGQRRQGITKHRRQATFTTTTTTSAEAVKVHLKIDNTNCYDRCFDSSETAAKFISLSMRNGWDPGFRIISVAVLRKVDDRCSTFNDTYVIRSAFDDATETSSGSSGGGGGGNSFGGGDSHNRLFGYSPWGSEESKGALVWIVIAAVVGGMSVVLLVFAVAVFAHRITRMFHSRIYGNRHRCGFSDVGSSSVGGVGPMGVGEDRGVQWGRDSVAGRTTSVIGAEKYGTEV